MQLDRYGEGEIYVKEMVERLMKDTVKADKGKLPNICSLDWEFNLSSIFVQVDTPLVSCSSYAISKFEMLRKFI